MVEFIIMIAILVVCGLLFGKADTKKELLNQVGLDLSERSYESKKENEFEKYCKKAMKVAIDEYNAKGKDEKEFLENIKHMLWIALNPSRGYGENDFSNTTPHYNLQVKKHYIQFARRVIQRRIDDLKSEDCPVLLNHTNYSDKQSLKKYIVKLWDMYQYPWPEDWMQKDGFL